MLPEKYEFLNTVGTLPKLIATSIQYLGLKEYAGTGSNNPVIMNMATSLGLPKSTYPDDEVSWCALYHTFLLKLTGKPLPSGGGYFYLRALTYATWGKEVKDGEEKLGDTLVFKRPGGNHVGLYIAESNDTFHVLGGNQSNSVCFTEIHKDRLIAASNYYSTAAPESAKKYIVDTTGKISANEQ